MRYSISIWAANKTPMRIPPNNSHAQEGGINAVCRGSPPQCDGFVGAQSNHRPCQAAYTGKGGCESGWVAEKAVPDQEGGEEHAERKPKALSEPSGLDWKRCVRRRW